MINHEQKTRRFDKMTNGGEEDDNADDEDKNDDQVHHLCGYIFSLQPL